MAALRPESPDADDRRDVRVFKSTRPGGIVKVHRIEQERHADGESEGALRRWLLRDRPTEPAAPYETEARAQHHQHSWWQVVCLTGVDYFSTLGYQPGIAALAAGALSPIATLILVLLTLFGALPMYRRVAEESPHGEGSIAMLERLLPWWQGKLFVLCLLGFVATDFVITITLSAADATAHLLENPFVPHVLDGQSVAVTLFLIALLGAVFLKGFKEAIGIAVILVASYLLLNAIVVGVAIVHLIEQPHVVADWKSALLTEHGNPFMMVAVALLLFPKLALGLSGFETGVAVMPLVKGDPSDTYENPAGRIRNTHRLLASSALIMSVFLILSAITTITLIPAAEFEQGGKANGRALAYLAHAFFGDAFGTLYDLSTIAILWFAGASAMAGLLNIVPRYLPRYGMAPSWTLASRPLVLVFTTIAFAVTILFEADVDAQGGAYATGVLVLMTSAAVAVTLAMRRRKARSAIAFAAIAVVFVYTTAVNVFERPDGVKIAAFFIGAIVVVSLISRVWRSTELRSGGVVLDPMARRFVEELDGAPLRIIATAPHRRDRASYDRRERFVRAAHRIGVDEPVFFLEVTVRDPSEFAPVISVAGEDREGRRVLRAEGSSVPNTIAALLMHLRDQTGTVPHAYFSWSENDPLGEVLRFVLFGEGDIAPVTHEILREAEPDPERRPEIHAS
jgi:hypothetical protein